EHLTVILGEVPEPDVVADLAIPTLEREHAGEELEQRGLAGSVRADERHPLPPLDVEIDTVVHDGVAVALARPMQLEHVAAAARRFGEPDLERPLGVAVRWWKAVDPFELLDAALHERGLRGLGTEPADERLDPLDLLLLILVGLPCQLEAHLALGEVAAVVHGVVGDPPVEHLRDPLDRDIKEIPIVGHQDNRARVGPRGPPGATSVPGGGGSSWARGAAGRRAAAKEAALDGRASATRRRARRSRRGWRHHRSRGHGAPPRPRPPCRSDPGAPTPRTPPCSDPSRPDIPVPPAASWPRYAHGRCPPRPPPPPRP